MVCNNLNIGLEEFKRMKSLDRDVLIYNNLINIRSKLKNTKKQTIKKNGIY